MSILNLHKEVFSKIKYPFSLPELLYSYDALEPYIDAKTMQIHHQKHHGGYVNGINEVFSRYEQLQKYALWEVLQNLDEIAEKFDIPAEDVEKIVNMGGGHLNHTFFWYIMGPNKEVDKELEGLIKELFGSMEEFKAVFSEIATKHFGSGWAFFVINQDGDYELYSLLNQDNPYLLGDKPIIGLDVWEHAYYLKYQNRRAEYIRNWWNVLKVL